MLGGLIGAVAFSGSLIAYAKLQGILKKLYKFPNQQMVNLGVFAATVVLGLILATSSGSHGFMLFLLFVLALAFGVMMTVPTGGARTKNRNSTKSAFHK